MKKIGIILATILIVFFAQSQPIKIDWNLKYGDFKYSITTHKGPLMIVKQDVVYGEMCNMIYDFKSNGDLHSIIYQFNNLKGGYIENYHKIRNEITNSYGNLTQYQKVWLCEALKYNEKAWETAVAYGHLKYITKWNLNEYYIDFKLMGEKGSSYQILKIEKL